MDWEERENPRRLVKTFAFPNVREAADVADRGGAGAEGEIPPPRVTVGWGGVRVEWWTHSAGGVTEKDREMARLTDALLQR